MELGQIIGLIILGALAGTAVAAWFSGKGKKGAGNLIRNTIIGVLGALVGGFLFDLAGINNEEGILSASLSLGQFLTAVVGAIVVSFLVSFISR
jgi:uncharacterized membrane protein YeaQ/YmgE (transglycosylase-associated protein family)